MEFKFKCLCKECPVLGKVFSEIEEIGGGMFLNFCLFCRCLRVELVRDGKDESRGKEKENLH